MAIILITVHKIFMNSSRAEMSWEKTLDGLEMTNAKVNVPTNVVQKPGNIGTRKQVDGISTLTLK